MPYNSVVPAHHRFSLQSRLGSLELNVELELQAPWTVVYGPSGSGKSTILRALCGLFPAGTMKASFSRYENGAWQELARRPPNHRALGWSPQDSAVFPHLTAGDNVRFPSRVCSDGPRDNSLTENAVTLFRMHALAPRSIAELSGGERQRVSLARAFATPNTKLMLLDEPFSGLDRKLREALLPEMQQSLAARGIPCLSVTHDVDEALLLNADVVRMENGRVLAQGPVRNVLAPERDRLLLALRD